MFCGGGGGGGGGVNYEYIMSGRGAVWPMQPVGGGLLSAFGPSTSHLHPGYVPDIAQPCSLLLNYAIISNKKIML